MTAKETWTQFGVCQFTSRKMDALSRSLSSLGWLHKCHFEAVLLVVSVFLRLFLRLVLTALLWGGRGTLVTRFLWLGSVCGRFGAAGVVCLSRTLSYWRWVRLWKSGRKECGGTDEQQTLCRLQQTLQKHVLLYNWYKKLPIHQGHTFDSKGASILIRKYYLHRYCRLLRIKVLAKYINVYL